MSLVCGSSALAFPEAGLATGLATGLAPSDSWAIIALLRDGVAAALLSGLVAFACIHRSGAWPGGGCAPRQPHATT